MTSASTVLGLIPLALATGEGAARPRGDGCGRRRRHARLDPADALHCSGHVQLYFHRQTQKESMRRFLSLTWALCGLVRLVRADSLYAEVLSGDGLGAQLLDSHRSQRRADQLVERDPAAAGALPTLDFSAGYDGALSDSRTRPRAGETSSENGAYDQTVSAGLDLEWTIFEGFRIRTDYRRLQELKAQGELETRIAIEDFVASLAAEYYNFVQQKIRLKNFRSRRVAFQRAARIVEGALSDRQFLPSGPVAGAGSTSMPTARSTSRSRSSYSLRVSGSTS